jgi:hypothetical protein
MINARKFTVSFLIAVAAAIGITCLSAGESPTTVSGDGGQERGAPAAGRTVSSGAATVSSGGLNPARYDLGADEKKGGHTLSRHVGKTDAELAARLKAEPDISAASTYTDRAAAESTVSRAIELHAAKVDAWKARKGDRPNLVLDVEMPSNIGRTMRRGNSAVDTDIALIVLKWDGNAGYVLTSYPQER